MASAFSDHIVSVWSGTIEIPEKEIPSVKSSIEGKRSAMLDARDSFWERFVFEGEKFVGNLIVHIGRWNDDNLGRPLNLYISNEMSPRKPGVSRFSKNV